MRLWRFPIVTAALVVAFTMASAHDTFLYERQQAPPALPSATAETPLPLSTTPPTSTPVVVSTIFIPDSRPRPTDSSGISSGSVRPSTSLIAIVISTPPKQETPKANIQSADQTSTISTTSTNNNNNNNNDSLITGAASFDQRDVIPTIVPDAPATAFFLVLFLAGTAFYAVRVYNNRGNSPTLSAIVLTFCILRVIGCGLRIAWTVMPQNEGLQISEMISLNVGSVIIFMASAVLAKLMVRQFALTSLSGSNWRLTLWWLSKLLLIFATLSSILIIVLHSAGASQLAHVIASNGTLDSKSLMAQKLLIAGLAWLFALGAMYMLLIVVVVSASRSLSRRYENLGRKLAVFFTGALLLEIGQGFRLFIMSRPIFYITGFMLEVLVISLYALADPDRMFSTENIDAALANYAAKPRSSLFNIFRNDEGSPGRTSRGVAHTPMAERGQGSGGGITIRQSLHISVAPSTDAPTMPELGVRPSSITSEQSTGSKRSNVSGISSINFPLMGPTKPTSTISSMNFPLMGPTKPTSTISSMNLPVMGPTKPASAYMTPANQQLFRSGSVNESLIIPARSLSSNSTRSLASKASSASTVPGRGKVPAFSRVSPYPELSPYAQASPYDAEAKTQNTGLSELKKQLDDYDHDAEMPEDHKDLY